MTTIQTTRHQADQVMAQMVHEVQRVFPSIPVRVADSGPECEDGVLTIYIPEIEDMAQLDIDSGDVTDSLRELLSDLQIKALTEDKLLILVNTQITEQAWDPDLSAKLVRHIYIVQTVSELYTALHNTVVGADIALETHYYPEEGVDAEFVVHGATDEIIIRITKLWANFVEAQPTGEDSVLRLKVGKSPEVWRAEQAQRARGQDDPQQTETIRLKMPVETLTALENIAESRTMAPEALMRLYIEQGLVHDFKELSPEIALQSAAKVLGQHLQREEAAVILDEMRQENQRRLYTWLKRSA